MDLVDGVLWTLAMSPARHDPRRGLARAEGPLAAEPLAHVEPLYEAIERRVDELGRPAAPNASVPTAHHPGGLDSHAMSTPKNGNDRYARRAGHDEPDESRKGPGDHPAPKRHLRPLVRPRTGKLAPHGDHGGALIRRLMKETFLKSRPAIEVALRQRFSNPATVQDCMELLARLEGELP